MTKMQAAGLAMVLSTAMIGVSQVRAGGTVSECGPCGMRSCNVPNGCLSQGGAYAIASFPWGPNNSNYCLVLGHCVEADSCPMISVTLHGTCP